MTKANQAVDLFNNNYNCAQAVFSSFSEDYNLDKDKSLKIACAFGAGMGKLQKTCGAVTGTLMAIGLKFGKGIHDDDSCKQQSYDLGKKFIEEFIAIHGSVECIELLGYNMNNEAEMEKIIEKNLFEVKCAKYVEDAVLIAEKLFTKS